jgi:hypothetical protein
MQGCLKVPSCFQRCTECTPGVYLAVFADDTCMYVTDRKGGYCSQNAAEQSVATVCQL